MGIVHRSNSLWASPLHMVPKSSGGWRPCGDCSRRNAVTATDRYLIPHIQDFTANVNGVRICSKVDLVRGYHQIPVHTDNIPKRAIISPFGLFKFLGMTFWSEEFDSSFPASQRLMSKVSQGLDFVFIYVDENQNGCPYIGD